MTRVFLHGLGQIPGSWEKTVGLLGGAESCICPDLTKTRGKPLTYRGIYSKLCETLGGLEGPLELCGLSLGGVLALNYAADCPEKVGSLVLIAAQYKMPKKLLKFQDFLFKLTPERAFSGAGFSKADAISLCKTMSELDFTESLGKIECPALIICGEKDRANRKAAEEMSEKIRNGRLVTVKNAGHEINVEAPEELAEIIRKQGSAQKTG